MTRRLIRYSGITVIALAALAAIVWFGGRAWLSRSVARQSGEFTVRGIDAPVGIMFDDRGVPRIDARSERGAAFALGWSGFVELERTPHALNPRQGWLASCNNQPVGSDWPDPIPGFYDPYRITRAASLLDARPKWTGDEVAAMQLDLVSGRALRWKSLAAEGAEAIGRRDVARRMIDWDGSMSITSNEAAIYAVWWYELGRAVFEDELGAKWGDGRSVQEQVLGSELAEVIDDERTNEPETSREVSARAMSRALSLVGAKRYGELSTLTVAHPLSRVAILDRRLSLSRGPLPYGGDLGSLNANFNSYHETASAFRSHIGPSMRFVLDWSNVDAFSIALAFGQSGNPLSPNFDDFFESSLRGKGWIVPYSMEGARRRAVSELRLVPARTP